MLNWPAHTTVVEVGPRDGLQSLPRWVDTAQKVALVDRLSDTGLPVIEVTSFAHPKAVPHLQDAEEVLARIRRRPGTVYRALVPNARGAERAVRSDAPPDALAGLVVASGTYQAKNQRMTIDAALEQAIAAGAIARAAGMSYVVTIAMAFWDIYEGLTPQRTVLDLVDRLHRGGRAVRLPCGQCGHGRPTPCQRPVWQTGARLARVADRLSCAQPGGPGHGQHPGGTRRRRAVRGGLHLRVGRGHCDAWIGGAGGQPGHRRHCLFAQQFGHRNRPVY